jgi:hypothetical protein
MFMTHSTGLRSQLPSASDMTKLLKIQTGYVHILRFDSPGRDYYAHLFRSVSFKVHKT